MTNTSVNRQQFIKNLTLTSAGIASASLMVPTHVFAEALERTPKQTLGPFYPDKIPLDQDNDLVKVNTLKKEALGEVVYLKGKILDQKGNPVKKATVELWQCDNNGKYIHSGDYNPNVNDPNFQGYGRFETNSKGEYFFRTIRPVPYGKGRNNGYLRTPHIHFRVKKNQHKTLATQMYIKDHPMNKNDFLFNAVPSKQQDLLESKFVRKKDSKIVEWLADFNMTV